MKAVHEAELAQRELAERVALEIAETDAARAARAEKRDAEIAALERQDDDYHAFEIRLRFEIEGASLDGQALEEDHDPELWELDEDEAGNSRLVGEIKLAAASAFEPWVAHYNSLALTRSDRVDALRPDGHGDGFTGPRFLLIHQAADADFAPETLGSFAPVKISLAAPHGAILTLTAEALPTNATMLYEAMRRGAPEVGQWGGDATPDAYPPNDESRGEWLARVCTPRDRLARQVERWVASGRNVELFPCYGDWTERVNGHEEIQWVVDGVLPRGEVVTVAGASGTGKSSLVHSWLTALSARSVDRPRRVLGKPITGRYMCALIAGEEGDGFINYREKKHTTAWGSAGYFVLNDPNKTLADHIKALEPLPMLDVLVVDTASSFFDGDEKSSAAVRAFLAPLVKLARAKNCVILLVHHMTKGGESVKSIAGMKQYIKGAGDFVSAGRLTIGIIRPVENGPELLVGPVKHNLPPEEVWLPMGTGRRYLLNADAFTFDPIADQADRSGADDGVCDAVFDAIAEMNEIGTTLRKTGVHELFEQKLPALAGLSRGKIRSAVAALIDDNRVDYGPSGLVAIPAERRTGEGE